MGPMGALTEGFNHDGTATTQFCTYFGNGSGRASGVTVQSDGEIVVSGMTLFNGSGELDTQQHFAVARFNADGTPDANFGTGIPDTGVVTTDFSALGVLHAKPRPALSSTPTIVWWLSARPLPRATAALPWPVTTRG